MSMRVAVFGESPTELGGVETSVRCISEYSPEEIEFEFFCPGSKTRTEESEFGTINYFSTTLAGLNSKHFYSIRAARKLDSDRFDLIHAHGDSGVGLFLYSHSIPVVWTLPGTIAGMVSKAEGYSSVKNYIRPSKHILSEYLAARACDYAVACSETVKDEAVQYYGMDAGDIRVIPYGIDVDKFDLYPRGEAVEKLDLEENSKYMIWVGLNTERKGLPTAVETAKRLDGVRLLVVGADGADSNDVKYFGEVPNADLPLYFAAADVFLFPTHYEGFPLAVLESLGCGTPIVTSKRVPQIERFVHYVDGFFTESYVEAVKTVLEEDYSRRSIRDFARENYSWEKKADEYVEVYEEVMKDGG